MESWKGVKNERVMEVEKRGRGEIKGKKGGGMNWQGKERIKGSKREKVNWKRKRWRRIKREREKIRKEIIQRKGKSEKLNENGIEKNTTITKSERKEKCIKIMMCSSHVGQIKFSFLKEGWRTYTHFIFKHKITQMIFKNAYSITQL